MYLFIFLGSRITADGDCSHEIKRHLLLGPGLCKLPKPPASRALCQAKRAPRAAFPSGCLAAQTKRWVTFLRREKKKVQKPQKALKTKTVFCPSY